MSATCEETVIYLANLTLNVKDRRHPSVAVFYSTTRFVWVYTELINYGKQLDR